MSFQSLLRLIALLCLVGLVAGIWSHSTAVTAVTVTPLSPPLEVADALGSEPDFRVDILEDGSWKKLATYTNRPMGEGQRWVLADPAPLGDVQTLRLSEDDTAGDDVIDEAQLEGRTARGKLVAFELEVERDMGVGLAWFVMTPLGLALVGAFVLGVFFSFFLGGGELLDVVS